MLKRVIKLRPLPSPSLAALSTLAIWPTPTADGQTALALQVWVGSARVCSVPQPTVQPMLRDVGGTAHARSSFPPAVCCMQGSAVCPNLPFGLCPRLWDEEHMPEADEDDARLYGNDEPGSNPGAAWLLVLAGIIGLAALVPSGGNTAAKRSRSCGAAALLGVLVGLYLALQLFPNQHLIQVGVCCTNTLLAVDILYCPGWFSLTGMLASACLGHCLVLAKTLLQLKHWSMLWTVAHALAIACMFSVMTCLCHLLCSAQFAQPAAAQQWQWPDSLFAALICCYQASFFSCTWLHTARRHVDGCAGNLQAIVCIASSSLAAAVVMIQMGGGGSGLLAFLVMAWASLLPLGLFLQAVLPLPPPQGPLPYGGLTPNFQHERAQAYRCAQVWYMHGPQHDVNKLRIVT